ncbi:Uncharacterized membrane protein [Clostridium sp. USBA 49]|uniref:putative ABC transporter permease n=1 Tax=Clostridium sp. USBA 49 TaxID=1881060 RepID=UPI00099AFC6D|nr:putative ABC transporter permease [Clostridium sp. USBA 49]SKA78329.1 Uncharacterized membrane protein [Clostridium sp. USBA 49]
MEKFYYLFYSFIIYSFLGWVLEVIYHLLREKRFINRGFLRGPVCPIYGTTAVLLIILIDIISNNYIYIFVAGALIASIIELVTGYVLEAAFNTRWWDYSNLKFNIKGYVCLRFSIFWGIISVFFAKIINPKVSKIVYWIVDKNNKLVFITVLIILLLDIIFTINNLIAFKRLFAEIQDILMEIKNNVDKLMNEKISKESILIIDKRINALKESKEKLLLKINLRQRRLLKAYPRLNSKKFESAIEEIKKKIKKK